MYNLVIYYANGENNWNSCIELADLEHSFCASASHLSLTFWPIRRLRDKLMEDERPELAMEISTRFGLETTAIWSAWGLTCLRKGDYKAARDKFSKFLKVCLMSSRWLGCLLSFLLSPFHAVFSTLAWVVSNSKSYLKSNMIITCKPSFSYLKNSSKDVFFGGAFSNVFHTIVAVQCRFYTR